MAVLVVLVISAVSAAVASPTPPSSVPDRRIEKALDRAGRWLESFPTEQLRFDAAVGLWHIRQAFDSEPIRAAWERARAVASRDHDNPLRRFWDPAFEVPAESSSGWKVPREEDERVNTNRVLIEALHCGSNGWRPETTRYVEGPMRDDGGYQSVHALWALQLAQRNGCLPDGTYDDLSRTLQRELRDHQPVDFRPESTLDIDLYGERLLMLILTGDTAPPVPDWIERLVALQNRDGSWGIELEGEEPYFRYHATMVAVWTLALRHRDEVLSRRVHPSGTSRPCRD